MPAHKGHKGNKPPMHTKEMDSMKPPAKAKAKKR